MVKYCNSCGSEIPEGSNFCVRCGLKAEEEKPVEQPKPEETSTSRFCTSCGSTIPEDSNFCVECGLKIGDEKPVENAQPTAPTPSVQPQAAPITPPPPMPPSQPPTQPAYVAPPKPKNLKKIGAVAVVAILIVAGFYVGFMFGKEETKKEDDGKTSQNVEIKTGDSIPVTSKSIGLNGGSVSVTDSSNPLYGFNVDVPEAASSDTVDFSISYSDIEESSGLPDEASIASWMINIDTDGTDSWNKFKAFDKPCTVTLPYDPDLITNEESVRFYYYDTENNVLDSTGFISQDTAANTITFYTGTFSNFTAIELSMAVYDLFGVDYAVDTSFRPANDGWRIANWGSYLRSGGNCLGMTSFAKWHFMHKKPTNNEKLYDKYIQGDAGEWRDDEIAIELATRCQMGTNGIWGSLNQDERAWATTRSHDVAYSILHGMIVSNEPQLIGLKLRYQNGTWASGGHAVLVYQYTGGRFDIYDPNYPGTAPGTDVRQIPFTYSGGFTRSYSSGQNAGSGRQYNIFYHAGLKTFSPANAYEGLYDSAENDFSDDTIFPTIELTEEGSGGSTPIDTDGDGIRDTTEAKVTITGTISGGDNNEDITSTLVFVSNQKFETAVNGDTFSQEVPLYAGENDIIILVTDGNTWTSWAGFLRDTIKSSASKESLTYTLTWNQDASDIDMHVLEPTIDGTSGRHIYYSNKGHGTMDVNPYLDIDDTYGYGPEHYYATENMTLPNYGGSGKSLYGTYKLRIHYYADHDSNSESTQPISWYVTADYIAFKDEITGEEYWEEESWNGVLTSASSSGTSNFYNSGSSWSNTYTLEYNQPNPDDYNIPDPPQNELPS